MCLIFFLQKMCILERGSLARGSSYLGVLGLIFAIINFTELQSVIQPLQLKTYTNETSKTTQPSGQLSYLINADRLELWTWLTEEKKHVWCRQVAWGERKKEESHPAMFVHLHGDNYSAGRHFPAEKAEGLDTPGMMWKHLLAGFKCQRVCVCRSLR